MLDYNFFSSYLNAGKASKNRMTVIIAILAAFIVFSAGGFIITELVSHLINEDIASMEEFLNSKDTLEKKKQVDRTKQMIAIMRKYDTVMETVSKDIKSVDRIKSSLIEEMNTTLPQEVFFENVAFTSRQIKIQGKASTRVTTAELLHNMKALGVFDDVHVSTIQSSSLDADSYTFIMDCRLKDVNEP